MNYYDTSSINDDEIMILSIGDAERLLQERRGVPNFRAFYRQVADYALDPQNEVYGDDDDYHNLASTYAGLDDFGTAFKIAKKGLDQYPINLDLLSDVIRFGAYCNQRKACEEALEKVLQIDFKYWNWRLFTFVIDYYKIASNWASSSDEMAEMLNKAIGIAEKFQQYLPFDERGYNAMAEVLLLDAEKRQEAKDVLHKAIFGATPLPGNRFESLVAPQCCVTYIDIMASEGTHAEVIKAAKKGIEYTSQSQPSAKTGYFVYMLALSQDALISSVADSVDGYQNLGKCRTALNDYRIAYALLRDRPTYANNIKTRFTILSEKSGVSDVSLSDDSNSDDALRTFLSQMRHSTEQATD